MADGSASRRIRFALGNLAPEQLVDIASTARWAEHLGFDVLLVPDHHVQQASPLLALLAAANATETLRVGTMVLDNDFRHPAVLAKELATLDVLSGGRLEAGIGAGWKAEEYQRAGMTFDAAGVRVDRLDEALQVLRALLDGGPVTFAGRHYRLDGLELVPRPVQEPGFPILVGGGGRRVLGLAGRHADIVNITHVGGGVEGMIGRELTADAFGEKVARVRAAAADRDRQPELGTNLLGISVTDDAPAAAARHLGRLTTLVGADTGLSVDDLLASPAYALGTVEEIAHALHRRQQDLGLSYWYVPAHSAERFAPVMQAVRAPLSPDPGPAPGGTVSP